MVRTILHTGMSAILTFALALSWPPAGRAEPPSKANSQSLQEWREARFGMFIHWGPVSLTEKEISWSRANSNPKCPNQGPTPVAVYDGLYKQFNPAKFDARQWVAVAKAAGMKYMILTAKHCDGFLLWDSKVDDYNIQHTPLGRDVCAELAGAAHQAGMRIGWYFSPMDWRDPDFRTDRNAAFVAPHAGGNPRTPDELRTDRRAVVRLGRRPAEVRPAGHVCAGEKAPAEDRSDQPARSRGREQRPPDPLAPRRLLHTRAICRRLRRSAPVGIVHDDLAARPMGLGWAERRRKIARGVHEHADSLRRRRR